MGPGGLFSLTLGISLGATLANSYAAKLRRRGLSGVASQLRLNFASDDRLLLASRISPIFPIPGAAHLVVQDVIYGVKEQNYLYYFTVVYTTGVLRTKHRHLRVARLEEPRIAGEARVLPDLRLAPTLPRLMDQYRALAAPDGSRVM